MIGGKVLGKSQKLCTDRRIVRYILVHAVLVVLTLLGVSFVNVHDSSIALMVAHLRGIGILATPLTIVSVGLLLSSCTRKTPRFALATIDLLLSIMHYVVLLPLVY